MNYSIILQTLSLVLNIVFVVYIGYHINNKEIHISKRKLILIVITTIIYMYLFHIFSFNYYYKVINLVVICIVIFIVFFEKDSEVFKIYLSIVLIIVVSDVFICTVLFNIMDVSINYIYSNKSYKFLMDITIGIMACMLTHIRNLYYKYRKKYRKSKNGFMEKNMLRIFFICSIGALIINSHLIYYCNNEYSSKSIVSTLFILSIFQGAIISLFSYMSSMSQKKEKIIDTKEEEYERLKVYLEHAESLILDVNKFKHDYNNMVHTMNGYINDNDIEGLKGYMNTEALGDYTYNNIPSLKRIKDAGIKGLLTAKISEMFKDDVNVSIDVIGEIESLNMDIVDFTRILGIFLDNAFEAARDSCDKTVSIMIVESDQVNVTVINSFCEDINIMRIYEEGVSSKGEKRGIGLSNVREIIDSKYDNVIINTMIRDEMFIQELYIS